MYTADVFSYIIGCMFSLEGMKYFTDEINSVHLLMDSGNSSHVMVIFFDLLMYSSIISLRPVNSVVEVTVPDSGVRFTEGEALHRSDQKPSPSSSMCLLPCAGREGGTLSANTEKEVCLVDTGGFFIF